MGTYTANKNLYMPTVGETGWGDLMNTNLSTIDTFLKPITVSGSTYTFAGNQTGGSVSATSITNSGTLTNTGKITANGGIAGTTGTFSGDVTAASFNGLQIGVVATFSVFVEVILYELSSSVFLVSDLLNFIPLVLMSSGESERTSPFLLPV